MKSGRMRWVGHAAHMGEVRNSYKILVGKPEGKRPLRRLRCRQENDIKWILEKYAWRVWVGFIWLRTGTSGRLM
jgi:hypothetical protein